MIDTPNYKETQTIDIALKTPREDDRPDILKATITTNSVKTINLDSPEKALGNLGRRRFLSGARTAFQSAADITVTALGAGVAITAAPDEGWKIVAGGITVVTGFYFLCKDLSDAMNRKSLIDDIREPIEGTIKTVVLDRLRNNHPAIE